MLIVIGKPGSGCTTFLKALANMREEYRDMTGTLTYGGRPAADGDADRVKVTFCGMLLDYEKEQVTRQTQLTVLIAEEDNHLPTMTVAQTLRWALH